MIFYTKKLKERMRHLESEVARLQGIEERNVVIEKKALPMCESVICRGCVYAAIEHRFDSDMLLGCTKELTCQHYKQRQAQPQVWANDLFKERYSNSYYRNRDCNP